MSVLKYVQRLRRIDHLIKRRATGNPESFANKVGLCRSSLMDYLRELREMGAPISYCKRRESYIYREEKQLFIGFVDYQFSPQSTQQVNGGTSGTQLTGYRLSAASGSFPAHSAWLADYSSAYY